MPTYQYACVNTDCGNRFELVQSFTDPAATECPVCGQPVRKVYGSVGVVFKGSGFYRTDSRKETVGAKSGSSSDGSSASASSSKDTGSSGGETKPAAKADSGSAKKAGETKVA
jgi:putative FmdB family regulatory protein